MAKKSGHGFHGNVYESRAHASEKVVAQETVSSPNHFQFAAEHPEHQHVHDEVKKKTIHVMEEEISERLPDPQAGQHPGGDQTETRQKLVVAGDARKVIDERFEDENPEVREQQHLHTRREVEIEADAIALYA